MLTVRVSAPFASFRKSYARSFAETYPLAPPSTVYGMLLSLVGERLRARHVGAKLAFAYARRPRVTTTLRKLSRYKYGVVAKQAKLGNAPDYIETLCGVDFLCAIDSSQEKKGLLSLEERVRSAVVNPETVVRTGIVCLGSSDDAVDEISIVQQSQTPWLRLRCDAQGEIELPVWVDHVGSEFTRWRRFHLEDNPSTTVCCPEDFVLIEDPRMR